MPSQHRPSREPQKEPHRPTTVLDKFYASVKSGNHDKMVRLLVEIEKSPPKGLWMHRALGLAFEGPREQLDKTLDVLFFSRYPPKPTEKSDFIRLALPIASPNALYRLLDLGFRPGIKTTERLLERLKYDSTLDTTHIKPAHLMLVDEYALLRACARAVVSNAPESWIRTLNAALPQPLPGAKITELVMQAMVSKKEVMQNVSQKSLDLARDLWWVDHNMAQLEYEKICALMAGGRTRYASETISSFGEALSMIARSGLEEDPLPEVSAPSAPRKRL